MFILISFELRTNKGEKRESFFENTYGKTYKIHYLK